MAPVAPARVRQPQATSPLPSQTALRDALAASQLERLLPDWSIPLGAVYWLTPPAGPRPKRQLVAARRQQHRRMSSATRSRVSSFSKRTLGSPSVAAVQRYDGHGPPSIPWRLRRLPSLRTFPRNRRLDGAAGA